MEKSNLKCPFCGHEQEAEIPENKCLPFLECEECKKLITAKEGECCVICSYGDKKCPVGHKKKLQKKPRNYLRVTGFIVLIWLALMGTLLFVLTVFGSKIGMKTAFSREVKIVERSEFDIEDEYGKIQEDMALMLTI